MKNLNLVLSLVLFCSVEAAQANPTAPFKVNDMRFSKACSPAQSKITLVGVGDILPHKPIQQQASQQKSFKFLWQKVMPMLGQADFIYGNLETPLAAGVNQSGRPVKDPGFVYDENVYTNVSLINTNPRLAIDLVQSGFDVVSTANNHAMDRGSLGVDRTIESLRKAGLAYTGTRSSDEPRAPWYTVVEKQGWRIAYIACSYSTNGNPDRKGQVLNCFQDQSELKSLVRELSGQSQMDAVIVTPHWGNTEGTQYVDKRNITLGRELINAGATAVIGTHPHWIQPWEKHKTPNGREGLIVYSTGNFVSNQPWTYNRMGMAAFVGLSRDSSGRVWINGVRYHIMRMSRWPHVLDSLTTNNDPEASALWKRAYELLGKDRVVYRDQKVVTNFECK